MVFTASQMGYGSKASGEPIEEGGTNDPHKNSSEELVLLRRKTNSPTIEDDFTIDLDDDDDDNDDEPFDEEPFDEPKITPNAETVRNAANAATNTNTTSNTFKDDHNDLATTTTTTNVDAEIDMLCWTGSELDMDHGTENPAIIGDSEERKDDDLVRRRPSSSSNHNHKQNQIMLDQRDDVEDNNNCKSVHSLVWSESELEDDVTNKEQQHIPEAMDFVDHNNNLMDQRDDVVETRDNMESREISPDDVYDKHDSNHPDNTVNDSMHAVLMMEKNSIREEERGTHKIVQKEEQVNRSLVKNEDNTHGGRGNALRSEEDGESHAVAVAAADSGREATTSDPEKDFAAHAERSTDNAMVVEDESNGYKVNETASTQQQVDETASTLFMAPSVTASVTKRTRNTKFPNPKSPRSARPVMYVDDDETTMGSATVMTADIEAGMATGVNMAACSMLMAKKKVKGHDTADDDESKTDMDDDEDLLDRFFENIESRVCKTPRQDRIRDHQEDGLKRLIINPFFDRLEKFDSVFEQLEEMACPEEDKNNDGSVKAKTTRTTPAAFAAAKFTQLLDEIEKFDPGFVTTKAECNKEDESDVFQVMSPINKKSSATTTTTTTTTNRPCDDLEKAYRCAEKMVKKQKRTSFDKKDQLQKMKEQWFTTRLSWKLRQSILTEVVKQNTVKAAKTTTMCVDAMVSSCHPSMSPATNDASAAVEKKHNTKKSRPPQTKSPIQINNNDDYDSESDAYYDASSIDNSDFFSMMSPGSEHSNIHSKRSSFRSGILSPSEHSKIHSTRRNLRLTVPNAESEDETAATFSSYSDHVVRSPQCMSPSSRFCDSIADVPSDEPSEEGDDDDKTNAADDNTVGVSTSTGPLAVITEESAEVENLTSNTAAKRYAPKKKPPVPVLRRWAYPAPAYYNEKATNSKDSSGHRRGVEIKEWLEKWKDTVESVYSASEQFLDRAQCASATISFADSNSFEDDHEESHEVQEKSGRDGTTRSSAASRVKRQNSIIEDDDFSVNDDDFSVSVLAEPQKKNDKVEYFENSFHDDDDLSGFETAANTMDTEQDERPPMLRLEKSRYDGRSCGSREGLEPKKSISKTGSVHSSVHSRLSTEVPENYTLADTIRHASLSTRNKEANKIRSSQEPRGNKLNSNLSKHVRSRNVLRPPGPPKPPKSPKLSPHSKSKDQQRIRSPRSSETNDTSDMTVTHSSSDVVVTQMADSAHSKRSIVIHMETPNKAKEMTEGGDYTSTMQIQQDPPIDDDGDKGTTIFSYNTTSSTGSTSSTEFKDCYQDSIPSMSTMGTVLEEETMSLSAPKTIVQKEKAPEVTPDTTVFQTSDENIIKSVTMMSISATVFKTTGTSSNRAESEEHEVESMPSASSYSKEEMDEDSKVEGNGDSEPLPMNSSKQGESTELLATFHEKSDLVEDSCFEGKIIENPMVVDLDGNSDQLLLEPKVVQEVESDMVELRCLNEGVVEDPMMEGSKDNPDKFPLESMNEHELPEPSSRIRVDNPTEDNYFEKDLEKDIVIDQIMEDEAVNSDELILESFKQKEFVEEQLSIDQPIEGSCLKQEDIAEDPIMMEPQKLEDEGSITMEPPKLQRSLENDEVKSTSTTKKVSAKLREPRSVDDRRRRRLRQRRKFEKVLRGEDDSSSMSSSTMMGDNHQPTTGLEFNDDAPLISASFDTGFGLPVIEKYQ